MSGKSSFAIRLRDLLGTIEATAVLARPSLGRGIQEQLRYACLSLPCDEAVVALENESVGKIHVDGVASADGFQPFARAFAPSGTPFAYLLGGGTGYASEVKPDDPLLVTLSGGLASQPRFAAFVPIHSVGKAVGGVALFRAKDTFSDHDLLMAERLGVVLSSTTEAAQSERAARELFVGLLPELLASDAPTRFREALTTYLATMRIEPEYQRRLSLANQIGQLAARGEQESALAADIVARVDAYVGGLADDSYEDAYNDGFGEVDDL